MTIEQIEALADIGEANAAFFLIGLLTLGVATGEVHRIVVFRDFHLDERRVLIADAVLEGILDEGDENERRYLAVGCLLWQIDGDLHLIGVAQLHQRDIVADEVELTGERHALLVAFVEHKAHHLRQFENGVFRLLRVDVHKGVDVVERVHEEVRIDLIAQVFQLLLQVLTLQLSQPLTVVATAEVTLDAEVGSKHQDEHHDGHDIPLADDGRCMMMAHLLRKRTLSEVRRCGSAGVREFSKLGHISLLRSSVSPHLCPSYRRLVTHRSLEDGAAVVLVNHKCRDDDGQEGEIEGTLPLMHQERCQQEIMDEKQHEINREPAPYDEYFRPVERGLRIADGADIETQQRGGKEQTPHDQIDQILLSRLFHPIHSNHT